MNVLLFKILGTKFQSKLCTYHKAVLLEHCIELEHLFLNTSHQVGYFPTSKKQSFYSLGNFKCIFESKTFYSKMEKICVNKLILSQPMRGLPLSGLDLTKQIYRQLHVSSRKYSTSTSECTSDFTSTLLFTSKIYQCILVFI